MAFELNEDGVCTPTVKNTFLNFKLLPVPETPRRRSVPASSRLCREGISDGKLILTNVDSDASTDMHTDGSTCSESGLKTPTNECDLCFGESIDPLGWTQEVSNRNLWQQSSIALPETKIAAQRLNSKADAFKPQAVAEEPIDEHYKDHFMDVVTWAKNVLQESEHVANVDITEDAGSWSIIIQPRGPGDGDWQTELLLTLAKEVLLDAASKSRCIYLMGYCSPKPFTMQPQGFEATLAAMESPVTACWHVFKKGFCRHGDTCSKTHPACEVPVRVLVESVQFNSPCARFVGAVKQEVANLTMAVIATLGECSYADKVEAFKDKDCQGWTIEVTMKQGMAVHKNYLLTVAKSALYTATNNSNTVYIMGYASKPFMPKSRGFVTMLGDMQDESVACWDLYSKGICRHDCSCRWAHPECLVPISVQVKEGCA